MQITSKKTRNIALLTGAVLAASTLVPATPAHADKSKTYKAGAAILGAASAYMILKGKTVPGAIAGAGAYYAYKKGQKAKQNENYAQYPQGPVYGQYPDNNNYPYYGGPATYPDNGGYYPGYQVPTQGDQYPDYGNQALTRAGRGTRGQVLGGRNPRTVLK